MTMKTAGDLETWEFVDEDKESSIRWIDKEEMKNVLKEDIIEAKT